MLHYMWTTLICVEEPKDVYKILEGKFKYKLKVTGNIEFHLG